MKLLSLVIASALVTVTAQAMPKVGDSATHSGTTVANGQTYLVQVTNSLVAYNASADMFTQNTVTTIEGHGTRQKQELVKSSDLIGDATIDALLADCAGNGGVDEVVTVPAGTFATCRIAGDDGAQYNLGKVAYGIVKMTSTATNLNLQSFTNGQ